MTEYEIEQTWLKVERDAKNAGLRDGISAGKDSNFQESFDEGYKQGFKNGFILGKHKGAFKLASKENSVLETLNKTTRGLCILCESENVENEDLTEVKARQDTRVKKVSKTLKSELEQ